MKEIPSAPGYWADESGNIWHDGEQLRPSKKSRGGYLAVRLRIGPWKREEYIHTLVCETFSGPRPPDHQVRHLDGNAENNRPENLVWGTPKEQTDDRRRHGTLYRRSTPGNPLIQLSLKVTKQEKDLIRQIAHARKTSMVNIVLESIKKNFGENAEEVVVQPYTRRTVPLIKDRRRSNLQDALIDRAAV